MGKKTKTSGKSRLDKFYKLAKEQGFRSRAAFKLIQLNKKYDFLASSKAVIDLCAAPGGWLQVAAKYMPVESILVGVDLVPIRPIPNCITLTEDITTKKCRMALQKALNHWKVDAVLNDGAPNVGGAWAKDAYGQAELSLHALRLACEFLRPGGLFICKVFRSQDSNSLLWVARQLFDKVEQTKPVASRNTSAEIYFVCQGYRAPAKIDPRLLDPEHAFKDISDLAAVETNVMQKAQGKKARARNGYEDGVMLLRKKMRAIDFILCEDPAEELGAYTEIVFDDDSSKRFADHELTNAEIKALCSDLKVLGKRDFKILMKWRRVMTTFFEETSSHNVGESSDDVEVLPEEVQDAAEDLEDAKLKTELDEVSKRIESKQKRQKKKVKKNQMKAVLRQAHMIDMGDMAEEQGEDELFALGHLKTHESLQQVASSDLPQVYTSDNDEENEASSESEIDIDIANTQLEELEEDMEESYARYKERHKIADRKRREALALAGEAPESDEDKAVGIEQDKKAEYDDQANSEYDEEMESEQSELDTDPNPLNVTFEEKKIEESAKQKARRWFSRDLFADVVDLEYESVPNEASTVEEAEVNGDEIDPASVNASPAFKETDESAPHVPLVLRPKRSNFSGEDSKDSFEVVPADDSDEWTSDSEAEAEMLAIGKMMLRKNKREEIIDSSYNRFAFQDDVSALPSWFVDDEDRHCKPIIPVSKQQVDEFKARLREINARPIKKIAEATARKKMKALKRWQTVKAQADGIANSAEMSAADKMKRIEKLYQKNTPKTKVSKHYVVTRHSGEKVATKNKPKGSRTKLVDSRMKADARGRRSSEKKSKRKATGSKSKGTSSKRRRR